MVILGESHFDSEKHNDYPLYLMAVPITGLLSIQAYLDWWYYYFEEDERKRIFYCLDNPLKKIWVYGNWAATIVYCVLLFKWLWIIQNNEHNSKGRL